MTELVHQHRDQTRNPAAQSFLPFTLLDGVDTSTFLEFPVAGLDYIWDATGSILWNYSSDECVTQSTNSWMMVDRALSNDSIRTALSDGANNSPPGDGAPLSSTAVYTAQEQLSEFNSPNDISMPELTPLGSCFVH